MILTRKTPLPVLACCRVLRISRASLYRVPKFRKVDTCHDKLLEELAGKHSRLGYRQLATKAGLTEKQARLRLKRLGLMMKRKARKPKPSVCVPIDGSNLSRVPTGLGQVLVSDFTYIALPRGFAYLAVTIDVFSRRIRGFCLSRNMKADFVLESLRQAAGSGCLKKGWIHHSDRGSQYTCNEFQELAKTLRGKSSYSRPGCPQDNPFAESFFSRFKDEEVRANDYQTFEEVLVHVTNYVQNYNSSRQHSSLGKTSPSQFERLNTENRQYKESVLT